MKHENMNNSNTLGFFYVYFLRSQEVLWILIRFLRTPNTDVSMDKLHPWFLASILWKKCGLYMDVYGISIQINDTFHTSKVDFPLKLKDWWKKRWVTHWRPVLNNIWSPKLGFWWHWQPASHNFEPWSAFLVFEFLKFTLVVEFPQMDSEGFIPIALIASFYRVQALTQDFNLILEVCTQWL